MRRQIIALGGGGFSMEPDNLALDRYILAQSVKMKPRICFVPTASGDSSDYIQRFYKSFDSLPCEPAHLSLFEPAFQDLHSFVMEQDIVYVGGGSTRNMLVLWREWGLDKLLASAYQHGIILAGLSAGANCWFEQGLTDPLNGPLYPINGLGLLPGSICPHFDGETKRKPAYLKAVGEGNMKAGYGIDDGAALHFVSEKLVTAVTSRKDAAVYKINRKGAAAVEERVSAAYLN